ncbi:hypothetical protein QAA18_04250 [Luteimonas sp. 8-5]|jgi:hypothetical protein|uniref:hypothetical protein n=1 Tax=Luteimonas sp. 8-5 TaxID=3039387 RepID=UPI002436614F|nr:hypothetical protein [Luteimonas sp. 8-5]MDG6347954.1 hypothetical protein [Luteimonas sp. 8-5]
MAIQGQCGKCGHRVLHVNVEEIVGVVDGDSKARILTFNCIHCHAVLGVQLDPRTKRRPKGKHEASASG